MTQQPVVIVGAGWAGLAAAITLTQQGHRVSVYESAKQAGGRARSVNFSNSTLKNSEVDNGQHLLIGAYRDCLSLMKTIGLNTQTVLKRLPLQLTVVDQPNTLHSKLILQAPPLPAPLHLLYALFTAKGLTFKDRFTAIRFGLFMQRNKYKLKQDISVEALFAITKQTEILVKQLWEPLCLSIMNTPIHTASANVFMHVFKDAFTHKRQDSDLLVPAVDLSNLFANAATQYIESHGGQVFLKSRVEGIQIENNKVISINIKSDAAEAEEIKVSKLILATAPQNIIKLINTIPKLSSLTNNIEKFKYEPIATIYLQYPEETKLSQPMIGLSSTLSQWVFDRGALCQQAGLISVVISCDGEHMKLDDDTLTQSVHGEISSLLSTNVTFIDSFIIKEKRATFACEVNINNIRPSNMTQVTGLTLAGDYTDTHYPATLEGAVRSGIKAANLITQ